MVITAAKLATVYQVNLGLGGGHPKESQDMPIAPEVATCPECKKVFPYRRKKRFCSPNCRKAHARKEARCKQPANAANSSSIKRDQQEDFDLAMRMAETLYTMPPSKRLGYIEEVDQSARQGESGRLRRILTNPAFIWPNPQKRHMFFRQAPGNHCTISQAADQYCRRSPWQAGVQEVVRGEVPEPATGIVLNVFNRAA